MQNEIDRVLESEIPRLLRLAGRLSGDPAAAEDLVQETLIRAVRKRPDLTHPGGRRAWLTRVLVNLWRSRLRRKAWRCEVAVDMDAMSCPAKTPGPVASAVGAETADRVRRALAGLPPRQRAVMTLSVDEGFSVAEIARLLEVDATQVKANLWHARQALKKILADVLRDK